MERIIQEDQKKRGESLGSVNYHPGRPEKARRESGKWKGSPRKIRMKKDRVRQWKGSSRKTGRREESVWNVERFVQED